MGTPITPESLQDWGPSAVVALILGVKEAVRRAGASGHHRLKWVKPTPEQALIRDLSTRITELEAALRQEMAGLRESMGDKKQ